MLTGKTSSDFHPVFLRFSRGVFDDNITGCIPIIFFYPVEGMKNLCLPMNTIDTIFYEGRRALLVSVAPNL